MTLYKNNVEADVRIGEGVITIKRKGSSELVQAKVVASDVNEAGTTVKLWLDRLVHAPHETNIGGHAVDGAFVTEITLNT
jgi:hypothetical protein